MSTRSGQANDMLRLFSMDDGHDKATAAKRLADAWRREHGRTWAEPFRDCLQQQIKLGYEPEVEPCESG